MVMELMNFLDNSAGARLVFGKKELEIIRKQLLGMPLKQSERNRLSKFIRPKLRFIAQCAVFKNEFELIRKSRLKELLAHVLNVVLSDKLGKNAVAIFLYGSFCNNSANKFSDLDVGVIFPEITPRQAASFEVRVLSKVPELVDVKVFNTLPLRVKRSVVENYKILYKKRGFQLNRLLKPIMNEEMVFEALSEELPKDVKKFKKEIEEKI